MRLRFLLLGLLFFVFLGLLLQSSLGQQNLAMGNSPTLGFQPDSSLQLRSMGLEEDSLSSKLLQKDTSTIYKWDEEILDWIPIIDLDGLHHELNIEPPVNHSALSATLDWEVLMNILYQKKYYPELDMSIFAPVFGQQQEQLNGNPIVMEGFIIPIDEEEGLWALSAYPIASCFFCGQASPASVISIYLNEQPSRGQYKTGDKVLLRGTLRLNYDDPAELYYLVKEAEIRQI